MFSHFPFKTYLKSKVLSLLLLFCFCKSYGQKNLKLKFQDWIEDDDRIKVRSWYAEANTPINDNWDVGVTGMVDTISGATPNGRPPTTNNSEWLAKLNEERKAGILNLNKKGTDYDFSFEVGLSDEPDYLSRSYAAQISRGFAEDTLIVTTGVSYLDDEVDSGVPGGPGLGIQSKKTPELMVGVYRMLDSKSSVSLNLTYGRPKGYLSDPYKQIGATKTLFPGDPVLEKDILYLYPENRPDERDTFTVYLEGKKYFEELDGSVDTSYRFFSDDSGLTGHTIELKWMQRLSEKFVISPLYRIYQQSQADFYNITLDGTGKTPVLQPNGNTPHYSADYRLSELRASTYGLKITYFHRSDLSLDLSLDRYLVNGRDGRTDQRVYPDAQVLTMGMQWEF